MFSWKQVLKAILLTAVFAAIFVADGLVLLGDSPGAQTRYLSANIYGCVPVLKGKHYTDDGTFDGCKGAGYDCIEFPLAFARISISTEGIHIE
jgi:hypothetical protein